MKYSYVRREVIIEDGIIELTCLENELLDLIWNKESKAISFKELNEKLYANIGKSNISSLHLLTNRMIDKGVPIKKIRGYGIKIPREEF